MNAALGLFTERGFHTTSVDDIATAAGISRATLYQYFESKEAVFVELMDEAGGALARVTRRLGQLGATAEGYDNLHWWLGEWSWVFDRYAALFIEWANVNSPSAPLRPKLVRFINFHTEVFDDALAASGGEFDNPAACSILVLSLANRFNYIRHVYRPGLPDELMLSSFTTAVQLFLFPATPRAVLARGPRTAPRPVVSQVQRPDIVRLGPLATLPPRESVRQPSGLDGLGPRAEATVSQLLDAAGRVFAANGFDAANVDQIVTAAGVARGTFYRYFDDKLELMCALAADAAKVMSPLFRELATMKRHDPERLRGWLRRFLAAQNEYAGVLRAWTEGFPIDPAVLAPAADVVGAMGEAMSAIFGPPRDIPLDRRAAGMLLAGLLEHFPNEGLGTRLEPSPEDIVETQARFVERVIYPS